MTILNYKLSIIRVSWVQDIKFVGLLIEVIFVENILLIKICDHKYELNNSSKENDL